MATLTEPRHPAEFLLSEANGHRSRDVVTLASNGSTEIEYEAGAVLGKVTASGKYAVYDSAAVDGTQSAAAVLYEGVTVPATGDLAAVAVVRDAEVKGDGLVYAAGQDAAAKTAAATDLAALGIVIR